MAVKLDSTHAWITIQIVGESDDDSLPSQTVRDDRLWRVEKSDPEVFLKTSFIDTIQIISVSWNNSIGRAVSRARHKLHFLHSDSRMHPHMLAIVFTIRC